MISIKVPWPISVNAAYRTFRNRMILSREGRDYKDTCIQHIMVERHFTLAEFPLRGRLKVVYEVYQPDNRRRDLANLDKLLSDCMTTAGVWVDDSQIDIIIFDRWKKKIVKDGLIIANIEVLDNA